MAWSQELKDKMKEIARKKRGILLKDIPEDMLLALTDEVKMQGGGTETPVPHTSKCYRIDIGPKGGKRYVKICNHQEACYLVYASPAQVEALKQGLPYTTHVMSQWSRADGRYIEVKKICFNTEDIETLLKLAHVTNPGKYFRWI